MTTQQSRYSCQPANQIVTITRYRHPPMTGIGGERLPPQYDYRCCAEASCPHASSGRCLVARLNQS